MIKLKAVDYIEEDVPQLPEKLIPFIWYFARQMRWQLAGILLLFGLSNILIATTPYFFKLFVEVFQQAESSINIWADIAFVLGLFVGLILIIQPILAQAGNWLQAKSLPVLANIMRRQLALYMHNHSYGYFQNDFAGRLAGKVVETPMAMNHVIYTMVGAIWYASIYFIVAIILFMTANWVFIAIMLSWLLLYGVLLKYFIPRLQSQTHIASRARSVVRGRFVDTLSNILTVKLFARARHEDSYLLESLEDTADQFIKADLIMFRMWTWLEILTTAFWAAVMIALVATWQSGATSAADVAMILPLALQVTQTSWWMSEIFTQLFQKLGEVEEGMEVLTQAHDLVDKEDAKPLSVSQGEVHFDKVEFAYGDKTLFDKLDLLIPAGQKIGLVGHSGAGKSSLVQILLRLFDIQDGAIKIDDQKIADVTQDSLREHIAVIPQMSDMLHRTIADNIRYGKLDATDEEVIEAAKQANAHEFILNLEDRWGNVGYDAEVGERGVRLSGGQRQRIAIARAILKNAPILVLDEATSALDSESERLIQESLLTLMQDKTVIAIAHRLSTIAHLDRLIIMEEGKIIEDGSHEELKEKENGVYAALWGMQSGGFIGGDTHKQDKDEAA